jgi:predicted transcriptional regulator
MRIQKHPNIRIKERRSTYLEPNIHDASKPIGGRARRWSARALQTRIARIANKLKLDTQKIRFELILELKALAEMAQQKAIDTHPASVEVKQNWARIAAYISQVINSISKTYDETTAMEELEKLEKMIEEATREDEKASPT